MTSVDRSCRRQPVENPCPPRARLQACRRGYDDRTETDDEPENGYNPRHRVGGSNRLPRPHVGCPQPGGRHRARCWRYVSPTQFLGGYVSGTPARQRGIQIPQEVALEIHISNNGAERREMMNRRTATTLGIAWAALTASLVPTAAAANLVGAPGPGATPARGAQRHHLTRGG